MLTDHGNSHEALLHETESPLVVDPHTAAMTRLLLIGACRCADADTSTLPLAASCAELDGASHCVCGARPAMPNPDPSLAAELFDLASNDDRPCSQRATDGPSGCVGGGAQRSVAA